MSLSARTVRAGRTRRPRARLRVEIRRNKCGRRIAQKSVRARSHVFPENTSRSAIQIQPSHHRADDAGAVLGVVNALRFASTRPVAGPSGIDDASARHVSGNLRDGGQPDRRLANDVDDEIAQAYVGVHHVSAARHSLRSPQRPYGARIRPTPTGHGIERIPHNIAACCTTTDSGWSAHRMSCEPRDLSRRRRPQDHAPQRGCVHQRVIAPWSD